MSYSSTIQTLFSGPSTASTYPPYNGLAVGPNYVVMVEGSAIEWTNLTGGSPTLQSVYDFFSSLSPTGGLYDQRVAYDSVNQRFVVIMQYLAPGGSATDIDIAVSKDANIISMSPVTPARKTGSSAIPPVRAGASMEVAR